MFLKQLYIVKLFNRRLDLTALSECVGRLIFDTRVTFSNVNENSSRLLPVEAFVSDVADVLRCYTHFPL